MQIRPPVRRQVMSIFNSTQEEQKSQSYEPKTAAIYCRVSTGRQENEATIESQLDEARKAVEDDGNLLLEENIFVDDGWTGELLARPSLDELRTAAAEGKFQIWYVYDRGRIARDFGHQEVVIDELNDREIEFVTLHDIAATTPEQAVMQKMQGVFHEYERVKIAERMRRGKLFKTKNGVLINGHALYGWNYIKKTDTVPAHCTINEEEARVVRMIIDWFDKEDFSIREIIRELHRFGIPPRKKKSEVWTKGPVIRILENESYFSGKVYYFKSEAVVAKNPTKNIKYKKVKKNSRKPRPKDEWVSFDVPAIMTDYAQHERILEKLKLNQKYSTHKRKYPYLLTGKIYCECGNPRVGDGCSNTGHHYYRCSERVKKILPDERLCKSKGINAEELDKTVWAKLSEFLHNPSSMENAAESYLKTQNSHDKRIDAEIQSLEKLILKVDEEESRYIRAYGNKIIDDNQLREAISECRRRKIPYLKEIETLRLKKGNGSIPQVKVAELCNEAKNVLKSINIQNKTKVIRELVEKIIINENKEVIVWGHLPILTRKLGYGTEDRHLKDAIPFLRFSFSFPTPKPNKARLITKRDLSGRIIRAEVPVLS